MTVEEYIQSHRTDNVQELALHLHGRSPEEARHILQQIEGWQRLRLKVPSWAATEGLQYPVRLSLEQCSSEATARYKASLMPDGDLLVDLTGGLGVDFAFMAPRFRRAVYVERNADLCALARHNLPLLGLPHAQVVEGDGVEYLRGMTERATVVFLDPFRRDDNGRKTVLIEDCHPNVVKLAPLLRNRCTRMCVKLSPMLDVTQALTSLKSAVPEQEWEVHIVGTQGEVKEILLLSAEAPCMVCHDDACHVAYTPSEAHAAHAACATPQAGHYLYEPAPVLMKAGPFALIAQRYGVAPLHPNSHLYVADHHVADFPGRRFRILEISGYGKRELRDMLTHARQRQEGKSPLRANLAVRNFPAAVSELRRRLNLAEGGSEYWFATTCEPDNRILLACEKA